MARTRPRGGTTIATPCPAACALFTLLALSCGGRAAAPELTPQAAQDAPPPAVAAPEPAPAADPAPVYAALEAAIEEYSAGVERIAAGDEIAGEGQIIAANESIDLAAADCAAMDGCDLGRFVEAFRALLSRQGIALKTQAARADRLEDTLAEEEPHEPGTSPFVAAMPELGRTLSLLHGNELRDIIAVNGPVNAALDDWLTWMRPMLIEAWENYQFLRGRMAPVYEQAGLPEALLFAMLATETGGKVHAVSRAGAAGPLQFIRSTGRRYGLEVENGFDMRLDPEAATRANVAYMNDQFARLNENLELALAAYNGGENRVYRLHRDHKDAGFWDSRIFYAMPRETREYVPRVLAAAWLFLHPADYGLEWPTWNGATSPLAIEGEISLSELAICLGQTGNSRGWFRTLRNLNPRLGPGDRIPAGSTIEVPESLLAVYAERCVAGELRDTARMLHDASYPEEPEMVPYTVRRGDTLGSIASRHACVTLAELAAINDIRPPGYVIRVGQRIKIPGC